MGKEILGCSRNEFENSNQTARAIITKGIWMNFTNYFFQKRKLTENIIYIQLINREKHPCIYVTGTQCTVCNIQ